MQGFKVLLGFGLKRRMKDSFVLSYSIVYPLALILLLGYVTKQLFQGDPQITSYTYYTLVLIPFFILQNLIIMVYVAKDENFYKTSFRFVVAPIDHASIVISKIISSTIVVFGCVIIDLAICCLFLKVKLPAHLGLIILLFLSEIFMVSALGIYLGTAFKSFNTIKSVLNVPVNVFALLGGAFFPIGAFGEKFIKLSYISPLTWISRGSFAALYDNSIAIIGYTIVILVVIALLFMFLSVKSFKKEAFL